MPELSTKAQALVRAGRAAYLPGPEDRERVRQALQAHLGNAPATPPVRPLWLRVAVPLAGLGVVGGVVAFALRQGEPVAPAPVVSAAVVVSSSGVVPPAPSASAVERPEPSPEPAPRASTPRRPSDRLAEEVAILSRAANELRSGRPARALEGLNEHQTKFPGGALTEERRAARAEALCALGRMGEARAELAKLGGSSPTAQRARQYCDKR
jgi:hypothetical protein